MNVTSRAVLDGILQRRSVRTGFRDDSVDVTLLEQVLECGMAAPSSKNARPWRFHVVEDRSVLAAIAREMSGAEGIEVYVPHDPRTGAPQPYWQSTVVESASVLLEVPCAIVIENRGVFSGGREVLASASRPALVGSLAGYGFECIGLGAAVQNMWLAANALGLAASFMGDVVIAEPAVKQVLSIEGDLVGILALGYSDVPPTQPREAPAETQVDQPVVWHGTLPNKSGSSPRGG